MAEVQIKLRVLKAGYTLKKFTSRYVSIPKIPLRNNFCSFTTSQTGAK